MPLIIPDLPGRWLYTADNISFFSQKYTRLGCFLDEYAILLDLGSISFLALLTQVLGAPA